ncbi:hypothetical protein T439DRAFT_285325, partial [Meredithblackwellia eburnea MCA 4105]
LQTLPPLISYTPVHIPLSSPHNGQSSTFLLRRDLFDARFQVIAQSGAVDEGGDSGADLSSGKIEHEIEHRFDDGQAKETFVDEETDLVKGVYEGGLKTWECSLDLVDCLCGLGFGDLQGGEPDMIRGKSVLEIGCGTALPTCALFSRLVAEVTRAPSTPGNPAKVTRIHLQDYNKQVLSLITLPNILLAFAKNLTNATTSSPLPLGDVELSPEYIAHFEAFLERERIELNFYQGDWKGMEGILVPEMESETSSKGYDIVLTSETVYELQSLPSLLDLLRATSIPKSLSGSSSTTTCLVACKRIYFGVGGGEVEFRTRAEKAGAEIETVWGDGVGQGRDHGVGRVVMKVTWK